MGTMRADLVQAMKKDAYAWFFETYDQPDAVIGRVAEEKTSDALYEMETSAIGRDELTEQEEGEDILYQGITEGWSMICKMRKFTDGINFSMETEADFQKGKSIVEKATKAWGDAVRRTSEKLLAKLFIYGGHTSGNDVFNNTISGLITDPGGDVLYDSEPFFNLSDNTRTEKDGSTYYNAIASALSATNFETLWNRITITNAYSSGGARIVIKPTVLVVPPALEFTARRILESTLIPGSGNNDKNVLQGIVDLVVMSYLTDTDAWSLGAAKKGIVFYRRQEPVIDIWRDNKNKDYNCDIFTRFGAVVKNWHYWGGSNFDAS